MLSFRTRAGASAASHHSATPARKAYGSPSAGSLTHVRKCPRMSESPQTIPVRQTSPSPCLIQNDTPLYIFARSTSRPDQSHSNPFQTHQNPRHTLKNHDLGFPPADESNPFLPSTFYPLFYRSAQAPSIRCVSPAQAANRGLLHHTHNELRSTMSRTTTNSVSSSRSLFENLEGRSLFSVVIGNVDFNNDGLITGDDYAAIDAEGADAGASERLGWALSVDYNQDGAISGDDYAALDGTNAEPMAYQRLDAVLEGMKQSEAAANAIFEGPDFNGDGKISGDDFGTLDSHSAPKADYD